jgi:hypothetical protein
MYIFVYIYISLSIYLSIHLSIYLSTCVCVCLCVCVWVYMCVCVFVCVCVCYACNTSRIRRSPQAHGRARRTIARVQRRLRGGGGAGARPLRSLSPYPRPRRAALTFVHATSTGCTTASHAVTTAPLVVRSCTRASIWRARRVRSAAAIGASVRVCFGAAPPRTARGDQSASSSRARNSGCTANAPARPLSRTSRVVWQAKPLTAANEEVRPLTVRVRVRGCSRYGTWEYQLRANYPPRMIVGSGSFCIRKQL